MKDIIQGLIPNLRLYANGIHNKGQFMLSRHIDAAADELERLTKINETLDSLMRTAEQRGVEKATPRWTPISTPPTETGHYLVLSRLNWAHGGSNEPNDGDARRNMTVAWFYMGTISGSFNVPHVTHWMELPEPPKEA